MFADSIPDAFGNALIDKWMDEQKIPKSIISTLDRLAYVGTRGMGALTYEPAVGPERITPTALDMRKLVEEARIALNADLSKLDGDDALREIIRVGNHFSATDSDWSDWQNQHALSVNGKFSRITDEDILLVGERYGLGTASKVLAQVKSVFASSYGQKIVK